MILFFNKNKDFISELSKDQLLFAEDEIKLNDQWVAEIGYPFSYNNKDFSYFGYFYDGNFYMYKIIENKNEDGRIYLKGIHIFFDEMQGHVIRDKKPKNKTVQSVCDDVFKEVGWNFVSSVQGLRTTNFYHISYLDAFDKILNTWNCEFYLEIKLSGGKISQKNVILKNDISVNHGKWFEYTSNLVSVIAEENHSNVFTAFIGRGKGEETESGGFGRKIKFDKIAWSVANGDPVNKPIGQDYVELKEATKLFGYPDGKPRTTVVDFDDEEDRENLLKLTYEYALENSRPKLLLKAKVYSNDKVEIGEVATIIRDDLDIRYQTKIIKINRNLLNNEKDIEVGDEVQSSIQRIKGIESKQKEQIEEIESRLEQALKNVDIDFNNEDGYNYDLKAGNKYNLPAGYYSFNKPIDENPTKVVYMGAGKVLIADEKGSDGSWKWKTAIDGTGIYGSEIVTHSITANKLAADVGQSLDLSSNESITLKVKSTTKDYIDKNKDQLKGDKGDKGDTGATGPDEMKGRDGQDGVAGKDGVGIKTTTITYGLSTSESTQPSEWTSNVPPLVKGQYLWTKTVWAYTDGSSETGYTKTYISKDGNDGKNGIAGKDGVGIKTTVIEYAKHTNGTQAPSTGWQSQVPSVPDGEYLWTKTTWNYTDGTSETGYSVSKMGEQGTRGLQGIQGEKGDRGLPGAKGADGKTSYTHIAYADTATGGGFNQDPANKSYIGMYTDFDKTDSQDASKYKWTLIKGAQGEKGEQGIPGAKGTDGKTPYLHIAYANSEDGKKDFNVSDSNRSYIGQYTDYEKEDSTDPSKYTWSLIKGTDGSNFTWNLIKNSKTNVVSSNNNATVPIAIETLTEDDSPFVRIKRINTTSQPTRMSLHSNFYFDRVDKMYANKRYTFSFEARASHEATATYWSQYKDRVAEEKTTTISSLSTTIANKNMGLTTVWDTFSITFTMPNDTDEKDIIILAPIVEIPEGEIDNFYLDLRNWKLEEGANNNPTWAPHESEIYGADGAPGKDG